ncbi:MULTISPECIES: DUF2752 domain-containing protein [Anaerostipes]|uniref:DUF2752 domain-containing protein n=1 Tax=Anaerostipes TaxID=207244 RepID=UPI000951AA83|nr:MULTISPECIES: DUF2752 domain-containing protein [Anaerostipes]MCI5622398.1 DUF2752 domain-containing protein [Anaerostipes sp.]MDY2726877.1 DUF2752 domain-containing protein [Anaerostipes faecalis]OLR59663.1 hypothetical protein BHF70_08595 [Anaerostipes sp. 494a]
MMILFKIVRLMPCFFKEVTHLYCPACGGTRAVIALMHLDVKRALFCNPTVVYGAVIVLWCIIWIAARQLFQIKIKILKPGLWMLITGIIIFLGFALIRNMAVYQFGYDYLGDLI